MNFTLNRGSFLSNWTPPMHWTIYSPSLLLQSQEEVWIKSPFSFAKFLSCLIFWGPLPLCKTLTGWWIAKLRSKYDGKLHIVHRVTSPLFCIDVSVFCCQCHVSKTGYMYCSFTICLMTVFSSTSQAFQ